MIVEKWVKASLYVSQVPQEKLGHICIEAAAIRYRRFAVSALAGDLTTIAFSRDGRQAIYSETVPDVPCNAWQLAPSISHARCEA
jgi:hypothetical protein